MRAVAVRPGKKNSVHLAELPMPRLDEIPGGRGVLLMRAFMSRVEFRDRGNHVVLEKERSA